MCFMGQHPPKKANLKMSREGQPTISFGSLFQQLNTAKKKNLILENKTKISLLFPLLGNKSVFTH